MEQRSTYKLSVLTLVFLAIAAGAPTQRASAQGSATDVATPPSATEPTVAGLLNAKTSQESPHKFRSLFFTPEEVANIKYALNIYKKNTAGRGGSDDLDEEDFLRRLTGLNSQPQQANRYYSYPQFFLESLVYHASNNWIVWINGQKLTQDSPTENSDLSVVSIDKDKAQILWRPVAMEKVTEVWDKSPNNEVAVSRRDGTVKFTLRPNQTFSSYVMYVLEGKVQPVTVDTHAMQIPAVLDTDEDAVDYMPAPDQGQNQNREGLGGLMNAYQNLGQGQSATPPAPPTPTPAQENKP